ncbi:c-type cytochrome [Gallaecimonas mangrovi]|uniref:c-type cytochrome n=1 Tax=Gallaecimonas mangrovi TaxID=2291597 RepID=UPI000E204ACA|nr:c-type cytochrome [Gallaecimonas mangrovi]
MKNIVVAVAILLTSISFSSFAKGDITAGKAKSAVCSACHGPDGNSPVSMYPRIAGQHARYIIKELKDLKLGMSSGGKDGRFNPVMSAMASPLSDQDMADLAAYFAAQKPVIGTTPAKDAAAGQKLYMGGDTKRGITACSACHGPKGNGLGLAKYPDISGQYPQYIKAQLEAFRAGKRHNDPNHMMRDVAAKLSDADINLLANYLAGLH